MGEALIQAPLVSGSLLWPSDLWGWGSKIPGPFLALGLNFPFINWGKIKSPTGCLKGLPVSTGTIY